MKYYILILLIFGVFLSCRNKSNSAQNKSEQPIYNFQKFSKQELKEDLIFLFNKLDSTHYNLYHKHSKNEFKNKHNQLVNTLPDSMNLFEFYYHTLPMYDMLEDAHSHLIFPFHYTTEYESQGGKFIPLEVEIEDGHIYIKKNHSQEHIPLYSEIISINNISSSKIIISLSTLINNERKTSENKYMSHFFDRTLFPLFGFDKHYEVQIKTPSGETHSINLTGISSDLFHAKKEPFYSFYSIGDSIGVIDINLCEGRDKFGAFCDSVFNLLKKKNTPNLIIDIRNNGGGSTFHGDTLLTYITNKNFTQYGPVKVKNSIMVNMESDSIHFEEFESPTEINYDNPLLFCGDIYMVANQNSFSSATMLAATFKCYNIGTLIGKETGGVQVFFDEPIVMTMTNTGIRFLASHQYRWCACGQSKFRGIIPDYKTNWNIQDKINGVDTEMELINELIKAKTKLKKLF